MTPEEIMGRIQVLVIPEPTNEHLEDGSLAPTATFWLHTIGMGQFGRPNLEMRGVPLLSIPQVFMMLNSWAAHSVDDEVKLDQRLVDCTLPGMQMLIITSESADEDGFWAREGSTCLSLEVERASAPTCCSCGGSCNHEEEGPGDEEVYH